MSLVAGYLTKFVVYNNGIIQSPRFLNFFSVKVGKQLPDVFSLHGLDEFLSPIHLESMAFQETFDSPKSVLISREHNTEACLQGFALFGYEIRSNLPIHLASNPDRKFEVV